MKAKDLPYGFKFTAKHVDLYWQGYGVKSPYSIELNRIDTEAKILAWLVHLGEKEWPGMTGRNTGELIRKLAQKHNRRDPRLVGL